MFQWYKPPLEKEIPSPSLSGSAIKGTYIGTVLPALIRVFTLPTVSLTMTKLKTIPISRRHS